MGWQQLEGALQHLVSEQLRRAGVEALRGWHIPGGDDSSYTCGEVFDKHSTAPTRLHHEQENRGAHSSPLHQPHKPISSKGKGPQQSDGDDSRENI